MDTETIKRLFGRIQKCLESLIGSSGHLAAFSMDPASFAVTGTEDAGLGNTRYLFIARAAYESEFTSYEENTQPEFQPVKGSIVLDGDLNYVRDSAGRILLEPWTCADPETFWPADSSPAARGEVRFSQDELDRLLDFRHDKTNTGK